MSPPAPHGNFQGYYQIRKDPDGRESELEVGRDAALRVDPRVEEIVRWTRRLRGTQPSGPPKRILDIGCNVGKITLELAQCLNPQPSLVLGVDIDPELIRRARRALQVSWNARAPEEASKTCEVEDRQDDEEVHLPPSSAYFPACFSSLFGDVPLPTRPPASSKQPRKRRKLAAGYQKSAQSHADVFPTNVRFLCADYTKPLEPLPPTVHTRKRFEQELKESKQEMVRLDAEGWDMILCLSLTKWIHLHAGDAGLLRFLAHLVERLHPGGQLVLERQSWESYGSAVREVARDEETAGLVDLKKQYEGLKIRPDDFDRLLNEMGLEGPTRIAQTAGNGFVRPLDVFIRPQMLSEGSSSALLSARSGVLPHWLVR